MKTIKSSFFSLLVLFIATSFIISCSKDEQTSSSVSENAKVSNYLKSFYKNDFKLGKSIESKVIKPTSVVSKTVEYENLVVTEVFVANEERARGYVLTNKETNVFLYFVDVDRTDYKMTKVDIDANQTQVLENIEQLDKYITTNQFDLIKVTQDLKDGVMVNDEDTALSFSTTSSARIIRQLVHVWANGCSGTHTYHSALFGLFQWETYEVVVCPDGVANP